MPHCSTIGKGRPIGTKIQGWTSLLSEGGSENTYSPPPWQDIWGHNVYSLSWGSQLMGDVTLSQIAIHLHQPSLVMVQECKSARQPTVI